MGSTNCLRHHVLFIVAFCVMTSLMGCHNKAQKKNVAAILGYDDNTQIYPSIVQGYDIIPLELTDGSTLSGIKKIVKADTSYIVFDNYNGLIVRFDKNGKYLNRIGLKGRALSEYLRVDTFAIGEDGNVLILDGCQDKILTYKPDGRFVSEALFPKSSLGFINDAVSLGEGRILVNNCIHNNFNEIYRILSINDKKVTSLIGFPMTSENVAEPTGKCPIGGYDRVIILKPFDDTIYTLDDKNKVLPLLYVEHKGMLVDDKYYKNHVVFSVATTYSEMSKNGYFSGFVSVFESEHHLLLRTYNDVYFLIDKDTNMGLPLRQAACDEYEGVPLVNIVASDSENIIGFWRPGDFVDKYNLESMVGSPNEAVQNFISALKALPEDGNPCLIVYHLK
jgi:hypothetical protein